jgi:peptidoglycan/LPS O-acetylase OafA/YrhL
MKVKNRNIGLDILRSIAVWNVLLMHLVIVLNAAKIIPIVWLPLPDGVDLFFVLSGYLIGKIMFKSFVEEQNTNKSLSRFIISRWFRTLPNYYFLTFVVFGLTVLTTRHFFTPIYNLTFTQNLSPKIFNFYAETWSLCVEEWYYILIPLLIYITTYANKIKLNNFHFLSIVFLIIFVSPIIRHFYAHEFVYINAQSFFDYRMITFIRLDAIAYGTLAAYIAHIYVRFWTTNKNILFNIGFLILASNTIALFFILNNFTTAPHGYITNFNFILNSIGILFMLPKIETIQIKHPLLIRLFTTTSIISYSMYLLQMTIILHIGIVIFLAIASITTFNVFCFIFVYIFSVYVISYYNYRFIEYPFLKLRDKILNKYFK